MRVLLSKDSKKLLFDFIMCKNKCSSLRELSIKFNFSLGKLQNWRYNLNRYIPKKFILDEITGRLEILDKQEDNWGKIKGGKKTYEIIFRKYGINEIKKRRINGGINSVKARNEKEKNLFLDIDNPLFLEFYGVLLGDGWMSKLTWKRKTTYLIGISGNAKKDRAFFGYLRKNIKVLFSRNAYLKERPKYNSIELNFSHKFLLSKMNSELGFPIGKKVDLKINEKIFKKGFNSVKDIIRGILDTDGCVYFDKIPVGRPYPCISITMKAPKLINQLFEILRKEGFKPIVYKRDGFPAEIKLKGSKQLKKWIREIGSSNPRNLNKLALVAQLDSAGAS